MAIQFDEQRFLELSGTELGEYVDAVDAGGRLGVDADAVGRLMGGIEKLEFIKAFYVLRWAVQLGMSGASNHCLALLNREGIPAGAQLSLLQLVGDARDFSAEHLRSIESMKLHSAYGVIPEQIEILRSKFQ